MKVAINTCYGGFGLSEEAKDRYFEIKGMTARFSEIERHDPALIQVIEEMGDAAAGPFAALKIVDISDDVEYTIEEYDGKEWIAEVHRTWS